MEAENDRILSTIMQIAERRVSLSFTTFSQCYLYERLGVGGMLLAREACKAQMKGK